MPAPRSLYDVLNVAPEAEPVVVEAAYKALIKKYHPDQAAEVPVPKDATTINEAFAILKDPAKRADYDHRLWAKQQKLRLAELQVASAGRPPRYVAVSGWLIAGLLACALAAVALGKSPVPPPLNAAAEAAAPNDSEGPARAAASRAAAAEAVHDRFVIPSSAAVIARIRAERDVTELVRAMPPARPAPRYRKPRRQAAARAATRRQKDFLERQGYIY
jgi:curved DNA-binding protein CbpA